MRAGRKRDAVSWIIVKGICDFADGSVNNSDKDANQSLAAYNAALVVFQALAGRHVSGAGGDVPHKDLASEQSVRMTSALRRGAVEFPQIEMSEIRFDRHSHHVRSEDAREGISGCRIEAAQGSRAKLAYALMKVTGTTQALIILDLDRFTSINAIYGKTVSNLVAKQVGDEVKVWCVSASRKRGLKISGWRVWGGDEWFLVISSEVRMEEASLMDFAKELLEHIKDSDYDSIVDGLFVTACAGVVRRRSETENALHMLRRAFRGLKKAKSSGGGSCRLGPYEVEFLGGESAQLESIATDFSGVDGLCFPEEYLEGDLVFHGNYEIVDFFCSPEVDDHSMLAL
jgi:diguanylate cyclase (GGDEF)-like protein